MNRILLPLIMLFIFVIEGSLFQVYAPEQYGSDLLYIPRFVVVAIIIIGIFLGKTHAIIYGLIFGLLYDVVYTELLGVYMFCLGFIAYLLSLSHLYVRRSYTVVVLLTLVAVIIVEYFTFGINSMLNITAMTHDEFLQRRLLSTLGLNFIFSLIILYPLRKYLLYLKKMEEIQKH
ncbi:rod shape-determining protein MreD [Alkalihalobacterium chitinilyticum]|uniref:Rod shape-determining protein MreD n=1 Tax=Alkalihalobacterium chitinilyticum TaxID=2980103 RepID=A0ABT5VAF2_9BACI|nr:rod shape-determining protein MreD [Alkalihalobacterium chitinilyticum]MDE5412447.1 rod shape-determining protein MreD [Alkalihalobacterium chitinilyticum]